MRAATSFAGTVAVYTLGVVTGRYHLDVSVVWLVVAYAATLAVVLALVATAVKAGRRMLP